MATFKSIALRSDHLLILRREPSILTCMLIEKLLSVMPLKIPNSVIESLAPSDIQPVSFPSMEWKSLVLNCRQNRKTPFQLAKLVIGSICNKPNKVMDAVRSPGDITKRIVFKRKTVVTLCSVSSGEEGWDLSEESAELTVIPLTTWEVAA